MGQLLKFSQREVVSPCMSTEIVLLPVNDRPLDEEKPVKAAKRQTAQTQQKKDIESLPTDRSDKEEYNYYHILRRSPTLKT